MLNVKQLALNKDKVTNLNGADLMKGLPDSPIDDNLSLEVAAELGLISVTFEGVIWPRDDDVCFDVFRRFERDVSKWISLELRFTILGSISSSDDSDESAFCLT